MGGSLTEGGRFMHAYVYIIVILILDTMHSYDCLGIFDDIRGHS